MVRPSALSTAGAVKYWPKVDQSQPGLVISPLMNMATRISAPSAVTQRQGCRALTTVRSAGSRSKMSSCGTATVGAVDPARCRSGDVVMSRPCWSPWPGTCADSEFPADRRPLSGCAADPGWTGRGQDLCRRCATDQADDSAVEALDGHCIGSRSGQRGDAVGEEGVRGNVGSSRHEEISDLLTSGLSQFSWLR